MKLTPEAKAAMLERYRQGEKASTLAGEHGITVEWFHHLRQDAGIPSHRNPNPERQRLDRLCGGALLPVYDVRLVSRPGEGKL